MRRFGFTLPPRTWFARRAARSFTCICKRFFETVFFATLRFFDTILTSVFRLVTSKLVKRAQTVKLSQQRANILLLRDE